ncbi:DBH-like monooxygenase protein 2 homolog [Brachionichthys hirsutus]|uniref:DBH-like monooxygenase protein 2 homolog n=1 Tax=Brachionichthys hirsutus TaxID=412623 RepID=UPI00360497D3
MRSLLSLFYLFLVGTKKTEATDPNLPFMEYLDQNHLVCLKWGFDDLRDNITMLLVINTTGWVGFGFSPNGGMHGSDIVMGGFGPSGIYFKDYHATGNAMPLEDTQQSYTLLSAAESNGQTTLTFRRSINSCDNQDFHITNQAIKLIYGYGLTDDIAYHHGRKGTKEVNLLSHKSRATLSNPKYFNATMYKVSVPAVETYYHCKIMKLSALNTKHHIYLIEPLIENPDIVHHLLLYRCPAFVTEPAEADCSRIGKEGSACFQVVAAWAVGGKEFELPENIGIPVGGEARDIFFRLEIHYNNVKLSARIDSSGLRLYYRPISTEVQQHDVGILTTGLIPAFPLPYNIPPKVERFHTYGTCNTTQMSQLLDHQPDLSVFAVGLHTHYAGKEVRVGYFRDGIQIGLLAVDINYNFELQQVVNLGSIKTIKPGDQIVVECVYSTINRTKVTKQGLGSYDEMCLAFLFYYPEIKISSCLSHPNTNHPLMGTSNRMFENNTIFTKNDVVTHETLLKTVPQLQLAIHENLSNSFYEDGKIMEMMEMPAVATCDPPNAASRLASTWIFNTAGIILLLLWTAVM